jgi:primosomal protein N' (replication factor Y)
VNKFAGIIIENDSIQLDRIFTYGIPEQLLNRIKLGHRVKVPFGFNNKIIDGYVIELYENIGEINNLKYIRAVCEDYPLLREVDLNLVKVMRDDYLCTYLEGIKAIIPSAVTKGLSKKVSEVLYTEKELYGKYYKENYISIFKLVQENNGKYNKNELSKKFNISLSSLNTMLKYGFLTQEKVIIERFNSRDFEAYNEKKLNEEQQIVVDTVLNSSSNVFLLHGVTGSGKTEVYMNLVRHMLNIGKESIILVPEISLTPQMIERFKGRFGKDVCIFHSKLSDGERYDEWMRVKEGRVKVAIGARSAVFLPFNDLGLIVIDEEHENSYKSDSDPKYNAREIAEVRCSMEHCKLILGSATPSVETYYKANSGKVEYLSIKNRADNALMPEVDIIDMREELNSDNRSILSRKLYKEIQCSLEKNEQVILFLNRRGFSTFVSCRKCGFVFKCQSCDIALTYHHENHMLHCHYCGKHERAKNACPSCGSKYVKFFGVGTEKVEQEINRYFPKAKTLRMDFDTTRRKNSYEEIYNSFKEGKADILIGTQMIAKGLDFKNVTLVGVIAADLTLNLPDFRAAERTFQLITQVSGRAGRGEKSGKVIVQTYNPENYSIKYSGTNDYLGFYHEEIKIREDMNYPPFSQIMSINFSSKDENLLIKNIQNVGIFLKNKAIEYDKINMLGPVPCSISKIKDMYRWQIIFKGNLTKEFCFDIKNMVYELLKDNYNHIRVSIDVNPSTLM